ncbi:MAG TPA: amino acid adenylation domain-containing protein, partial [Pyrinomonadaceae bacterium]|nr:amino acid adenylation domain-containing protein [Pyrinomonadaceae bacterium]
MQTADESLRLELPDLVLSRVGSEAATAKFDLMFSLAESGSGLKGEVKYSTELFAAETIERMVGHFQTLLEGIARDEGQRIAEVPLLRAEERRQLIVEQKGKDESYERRACIHQQFAAQAERRPEAIAIVFGEQRLSYGELNRRANQLAHHLRTLGVGTESLVGLCVERNVELVIGVLAILKAGGAYLPLDPEYPAARLGFMLEDAGVRVVLTQQSLLAVLPQYAAPRVLLDDEQAEWREGPDSSIEVPVERENAAYVIYTSGSTGKPKGVVVTHHNVERLLAATEQHFGFTADDVWTLFHSFAFDFSVWEIWGALAYGGRLVVVPYWVSRTPASFYELLLAEQVTILNQTPSAFRQLQQAVEEAWPKEANNSNGATARTESAKLALRLVIFGGEALEPRWFRSWCARHGDEPPQLINMYGITETTVHVTYRRLWREEIEHGIGSVIGKGLGDLRVYVLDYCGEVAPLGVRGELYVGGPGVARGYLKRADLTAERFVPDEHSGVAGARLYRTGDAGRYLASGELEYLGRTDEQVKVRGYRIELGEIEAALLGHAGVSEAVVVARREESGNSRLHGYVVPRRATVAATAAAESGGDREEATLSLTELQQYLASRLPSYMVPSTLQVLDQMPLTPNGKLDRRALPDPGQARPDLENRYEEPRTELERLLVERWREVLKLDRVGVHDDFFRLGGDSINGAILINRLQEDLGEIVHVVVIFTATTVAKLAQFLETNYAEACARVCRDRGAASETDKETKPQYSKVDDEMLARARSLITPLPVRNQSSQSREKKNPKAMFVLAPPRSGTTLLRVMLGGHSDLFAPPELELLNYNTLQQRRDDFSGANSFWLEGTMRALMEIKDCDAVEAKRMMEEFEAQHLTTKEFYGVLQESLGDKLLVDKTPSYALDPEVLQRAESDFEDIHYIHLCRHPLGMINSFAEARLGQIFFRYEHSFTPRELAELIWVISQENILAFLAGVPEQRQHRVWFEELVSDPERIIRGVCEFAGIEYQPEMTEPYREKKRRMS